MKTKNRKLTKATKSKNKQEMEEMAKDMSKDDMKMKKTQKGKGK